MHRSGVEPEPIAWKAIILPLDHRSLLFMKCQLYLHSSMCPLFGGFRDLFIFFFSQGHYCVSAEPWFPSAGNCRVYTLALQNGFDG